MAIALQTISSDRTNLTSLAERSLILRQLTRRVGELPQLVRSQIEALSLTQLEELGEALLDFSEVADLENWLRENA